LVTTFPNASYPFTFAQPYIVAPSSQLLEHFSELELELELELGAFELLLEAKTEELDVGKHVTAQVLSLLQHSSLEA